MTTKIITNWWTSERDYEKAICRWIVFLRHFMNLFSEQVEVQGLGVSLLCEAESYVSTFIVKMWAGFMPQWWDVFQMLNFPLWMRWNDVVLDMACCRQCHLLLAIPRRPTGRCWSTFVGKVVLKRQQIQLHICVLSMGSYFPGVEYEQYEQINMNRCFDLCTSFSSLLSSYEHRLYTFCDLLFSGSLLVCTSVWSVYLLSREENISFV